MNLLALEPGNEGAVIAGTGGPAVAPADLRRAHARRAAGAHRARPRSRSPRDGGRDRIPGRRFARHVPAGRDDARGARSRQRRPRARRRDAPVVGARRAASVRARRRASRRLRSTRKRDAVRVASHFVPPEEEAMLQKTIRAVTAVVAALLSIAVAPVALAQAPVEVSFYFPVAVGGPITKIIDTFAADFEKENPGDQDQADLLRHLPGHDHQGADGGQGRRAAGDVDPAVDRHVHADRRGRDRPVRRSHQDAGGPGLAQELLSGVHGEQPDRRQDVGHSVPALDDRALLQQGSVQGGGTRSRTGRRRTGRSRPSTRRSSPSATRRGG